MDIPIVLFHTRGNQEYLKSCVTNNSKNNVVYLIGDDSNKDTFTDNPNVRFFHIDDLITEESVRFKNCFVNYSSNTHEYEMNCYLRIFYLKAFIEKTGKQWVFHIDSDCVILCDINKVFTDNPSISYSIQNMENKFHMVASIHNALLNIEFCNKFIELCFDIYHNKTKEMLIMEKLQWHKHNQIPGGICDMTLYYLLHSEKILDSVTDLNTPRMFEGEPVVFDHNVLNTYGYSGENTYETENGVKVIIQSGNKFYLKSNDGTIVRTLSLHFQGRAKSILDNLSI